jgi:hypothetical protein
VVFSSDHGTAKSIFWYKMETQIENKWEAQIKIFLRAEGRARQIRAQVYDDSDHNAGRHITADSATGSSSDLVPRTPNDEH